MKKEIIKAIRTMNYKEGVMPNILDEITKKATKEIIDKLDYEKTFIIRMKRKLYKGSIIYLDDEIDIEFIPASIYYMQYGKDHLEDDLEEGEITLKEYENIKGSMI